MGKEQTKQYHERERKIGIRRNREFERKRLACFAVDVRSGAGESGTGDSKRVLQT